VTLPDPPQPEVTSSTHSDSDSDPDSDEEESEPLPTTCDVCLTSFSTVRFPNDADRGEITVPGGTSVIVPTEFPNAKLVELGIPQQCAVLPGNPKAGNDRREDLVIENLPAKIPNGPTIMCVPYLPVLHQGKAGTIDLKPG